MRGGVTTIAVTLAMVAGASMQVPPSQPDDWIADLSEWVEAVHAHEPGSADEHAFIIGAWPVGRLNSLVDSLTALQSRMAQASKASAHERTIRYGGRLLDVRALQQLLRLGDEEASRGDFNRLVTRGAVLHADIAMRLQSRVGVHSSVLVSDGRYQGIQTRSEHWGIGRRLLDLVEPAPSANETARLWSRATAAYLLSRGDYAESVPHLAWARERFPKDAEIAFDSGRLQENFSSARIQGAIRSVALIPSLRPDVASAETHLKSAEPLFRRAVELEPVFAAARVRLGRTLAMIGRYQEALAELDRVIGESDDQTTLYLAHMFLGLAHEGLGRRDDAARHYSRAGSLVPSAQSPSLALAQLARRHGDRQGALRAIGDVLGLPSDVDGREDPWWTYYDLPADAADTLVRELCARVAREAQP